MYLRNVIGCLQITTFLHVPVQEQWDLLYKDTSKLKNLKIGIYLYVIIEICLRNGICQLFVNYPIKCSPTGTLGRHVFICSYIPNILDNSNAMSDMKTLLRYFEIYINQ